MKRDSASDATGADQSADDLDFDEAMEAVRTVVLALERGDLGLTESLRQYETAINRLQRCHGLLKEAERKVGVLSGFDADGNPVIGSLDGEDDVELTDKQASRARRRGATPKKSTKSTKSSEADGSVDLF